jgi:hypothetical protein
MTARAPPTITICDLAPRAGLQHEARSRAAQVRAELSTDSR